MSYRAAVQPYARIKMLTVQAPELIQKGPRQAPDQAAAATKNLDLEDADGAGPHDCSAPTYRDGPSET